MSRRDRTEVLNALLPRCRQGDREAFVEVYQAMGDQLYGTALRMMKRPEEAEDVVQECFVRLFEKARTIEGGNLGGWLHRVTVNLCLDRLKLKANRTEELPADLDSREQRRDESSRLDLARAVSRLPERARLVFLLHDLEGYKHREVGRVLGISEGTSKSQLFRAREMLRGWLSQTLEVPA